MTRPGFFLPFLIPNNFTLTRPRCSLSNSRTTDVPTHDLVDTDFYRLELVRRPAAAKRQGLGPAPEPMHSADPVLARASVPLKETEAFALEALRRPMASRRVDCVVNPPTAEAVAAASAAAALPARPLRAMAAGAMEANRRPQAALRAGLRHVDSNAARAVRKLDLVDSEYYAMEAARRPRAMARLRRLKSVPAIHPEMEGMSADDVYYPAKHLAAAANSNSAVNLEELANSAIHVALNINKEDITGAGLNSGAAEPPNPFASLERMLEARLSDNGGRRSRGNSLRGAANYPGSSKNLSRLGSTGNLQRCNSSSSMNNVVVASHSRVACNLDAASGEVTCRLEDSGDVVMHCHYEMNGDDVSGIACDLPSGSAR